MTAVLNLQCILSDHKSLSLGKRVTSDSTPTVLKSDKHQILVGPTTHNKCGNNDNRNLHLSQADLSQDDYWLNILLLYISCQYFEWWAILLFYLCDPMLLEEQNHHGGCLLVIIRIWFPLPLCFISHGFDDCMNAASRCFTLTYTHLHHYQISCQHLKNSGGIGSGCPDFSRDKPAWPFSIESTTVVNLSFLVIRTWQMRIIVFFTAQLYTLAIFFSILIFDDDSILLGGMFEGFLVFFIYKLFQGLSGEVFPVDMLWYLPFYWIKFFADFLALHLIKKFGGFLFWCIFNDLWRWIRWGGCGGKWS